MVDGTGSILGATWKGRLGGRGRGTESAATWGKRAPGSAVLGGTICVRAPFTSHLSVGSAATLASTSNSNGSEPPCRHGNKRNSALGSLRYKTSTRTGILWPPGRSGVTVDGTRSRREAASAKVAFHFSSESVQGFLY